MSEQHRARRAEAKKKANRATKAGIHKEKQLFNHPPAPPRPLKRDLLMENLTAAWCPNLTGRKQRENTAPYWNISWGKCDQGWLDSDPSVVPLDPATLVGKDRQPIVFPDLASCEESFGLKFPPNLNLDTLAEGVGGDFSTTAINLRTSARSEWSPAEWREYMRNGTIPNDRLPKGKLTPQHLIFNMIGAEISNSKLAEQIRLPYLQQQLDPSIRFHADLVQSTHQPASLYYLSSKAGSFTPWHVDAAGQTHWLCVVSGVKWLYLLPPTEHNVNMFLTAESSELRADLLWFLRG